jgi:NAD-dependent DNA ligase
LTRDELDGLRDLLQNIIGGHPTSVDAPTALPLTKPIPEVIFDQNTFVFTGKFVFGTRNACFKETMLRGGICDDSVTLRADYVVIGSIGARDWAHTAWGNKIKRAVELQRSKPIAIINEETWARYLL